MNVPRQLLADLPASLPQELVEALLVTPSVRIERIVSFGQVSPEGFWYDQNEDEWVLLLTGEAHLQFENQPLISLIPGTAINIPAHQRHRVAWTDPTQPTVWLAVFYRSAEPSQK